MLYTARRYGQDDALRIGLANQPEPAVDLSKFYHLQPGDLIFTGTLEGVGPLEPGDRIEGRIEDVGTIALTVGPAE